MIYGCGASLQLVFDYQVKVCHFSMLPDPPALQGYSAKLRIFMETFS